MDTQDDLHNHGEVEALWPESLWHQAGNASEPVVVSAVFNGKAGEAVHFVRNARLFMPNVTVILYDLGMSQHEYELVLTYCNANASSSIFNLTTAWKLNTNSLDNTVNNCRIKPFDPDNHFPAHVHHYKTNAYRPLAIQETLRDAGCVLWMDIDQRFTTGDLKPFLDQSKNNKGVAAWLREETIPTTSLTHPKMFAYLGIDRPEDNYNFQHMVSLRALLLYNTREVKESLMVPWVKCSLLEDCIEPIGAQATGCRFDKKPQFRYSGCHGYDVSSLNILLGQMFRYDESKYVVKDRFFVTVTEDDLNRMLGDQDEEQTTEMNSTAVNLVTKTQDSKRQFLKVNL